MAERGRSAETKFAVIDEKLDEIKKQLNVMSIQRNNQDDWQRRVDRDLAKQAVINAILGTIGGSALTGVVIIAVKFVFGGS